MMNHSASLAMSTSVIKALPGKLDIKRHSPSILYLSRPVLLETLGCLCGQKLRITLRSLRSSITI